MRSNKPTPVEEVMTIPERRTTAEAKLTFLKATSYPHAAFSTMVMGFVTNLLDDEGRHQLSKQLLENERKYELGTFVRCLQVLVKGNRLNFKVRAYNTDIEGRVNDHPNNHVILSEVNVDMDDISGLFPDEFLFTSLLKNVWATVTTERNPKHYTFHNVTWRRYEGDNKHTVATYQSVMDTIVGALNCGDAAITFTTKSIVVFDNNNDYRVTFKNPLVN